MIRSIRTFLVPMTVMAVVIGFFCVSPLVGSVSRADAQEDEETEEMQYEEVEDLEAVEELVEDPEDELGTEVLPIWSAPEQYWVKLQLYWGKETLTVQRIVSGNRIRSELIDQNRHTVWLEPGEEGGAVYRLKESDRLAFEFTPTRSLATFDRREMGASLSNYPAEYIGEENVLGRRSLKYRLAEPEGEIIAWFDVHSGAPIRMETERDGIPFVIEWRNLSAKEISDDVFQIPGEFTIQQIEDPLAPAGASSRAIVGQLTEEQAARLEGNGQVLDWGAYLHVEQPDADPRVRPSFGGSLGVVAGAYVPGWLGSVLAGTTGGLVQR